MFLVGARSGYCAYHDSVEGVQYKLSIYQNTQIVAQ